MKKLITFLTLLLLCITIKADEWDQLRSTFPRQHKEIEILELAVSSGLDQETDESHKIFSENVIELLKDIPGNKIKIGRLLDQCLRIIRIDKDKNNTDKTS